MLKSNLVLTGLFFLLFGGLCTATEQQRRVEIDVLIIYDGPAGKALGSSASEWGQKAINNLQQSMAHSLLGDKIHFNLVGIGKLDNYINAILHKQAQLAAAHVDRGHPSWMEAQTRGMQEEYLKLVAGHMEGVQRLRESTHADIVLFALSYDTPMLYGMGKGYSIREELSWNASNRQERISAPYFSEKNHIGLFDVESMVIPRGGVNVFVHEMMHLFGCGHSDRQENGAGPFYYSDAAAFQTDDFRYGTFMGYPWKDDHIPHPNVPHVDGDTCVLPCLSGDYTPRLSGNDVNLPNLPEKVGDSMHNNRMVALRNAALISAYRMKGNECVLNDIAEHALPLPPMQNADFWALRSIGAHAASQAITLNAAEVMEKSIPGLTRENVLTTLVFGTNKAAPVSSQNRLPGASGKSVWYKLTPPADGSLRVGVRQAGTDEGFAPVIAVFNADKSPRNTRPLAEADMAGYLQCVECQVSAGKELLIQVDSGNAQGGQFSLQAQLQPSAEQGTGTSGSAGSDKWSGLDTLLVLLTLFSTTSSLILFIKMKKGTPAAESEHTPWSPQQTPAEKAAPAAATPKQQHYGPWSPQESHQELVLKGILYDGTQQIYTYPVSRLISEGNVTLGYDDSCGIRIIDDTVSGNHAVISYYPGKTGLYLMDAGSTNGSKVRGERLTAGERVRLYDGDEIQLGMAKLTITIRES